MREIKYFSENLISEKVKFKSADVKERKNEKIPA